MVPPRSSTRVDEEDSDPPYWAVELALTIVRKRLIFVIVALGVFGNMSSLLITTLREYRHITTCLYMSALSVLDTCFLLAMMLYILLFHYHYFVEDTWCWESFDTWYQCME
jgi:hypothetical protein